MEDVFKIAEDEKIRIDYIHIPASKGIALSDSIALDISCIEDEREEKVILAHELGHILTGQIYGVCDDWISIAKSEKKADVYAIKKLLPREDLEEAYRKGVCTMWELSEYFELPLDFVRKCVRYWNNETY